MSESNQKDLEQLKKELEKFQKGEKIQQRPRTTAIGKLFNEISKKLDGYQTQSDVVGYLYKQLGGDSNEKDRLAKRKYVLETILDYFDRINGLSAKNSDSNIISIPLYDIRIVGEMTNIVIIHGIYSIIPPDFLIPLEQRKLKSFKTSTTFEKIDFQKGVPILQSILFQFTKIFESETDLKDLILVGTGFTDTLSISLMFSFYSEKYTPYLERLERQSSTYQLLAYYSILFKTSKEKQNAKFACFVLNMLSNQLMKANGVEALVDLVLGLREDEEIDVAKIQYIVQILITSKPKDVSVVLYYRNIFNQIYELLVLVNRPLMNTILVEIIVNIYDRNKRVVVDFLFAKIWGAMNPKQFQKAAEESIVLTNEVDLNNSFNVCLSMSRCLNTTNSEIINELFEPIFLPLWCYSNFQRKQKKDFEIVLNLLKNIIILGDSKHFIDILVSNLMSSDSSWTFENGDNNLTYIKFNTNEVATSKENQMLQLFDNIDFNVDTCLNLVTRLKDSDSKYLDQILICVLNKLIVKAELTEIDIPIQKVIYLKLIQSLLDTFKNEIENSPSSLLIFANTYFNQYFDSINTTPQLQIVENGDSDDEDDDEIATNNGTDEILASLIPILDIISTLTPSNDAEKTQLQNLQLILKRNKMNIPDPIKSITQRITDINTESTKCDTKANHFDIETVLKQLNDPTPSIRVFALDKLTKYIISNGQEKKIVTTTYTFNLLISQLTDQEPFVYLNAIKNIVSVVTYDRSFFEQLVELYSQSKKSIDEKLRIGEILTKYISANGKVFNLEQTKLIVTTCISISRADSKLQQQIKDNKDLRMKMSSLSILGLVCYESGFGIIPYISEISDLVYGIITFEQSAELRRAAVVIINDIIKNDKGLEILKDYGEKLQNLLNYISEKDQDLLVCEFANKTLDLIEESFDQKLKLSE